MLFFNIPIPNIFHFGDSIRRGYEARYERPIGRDFRNSVLLAPLEDSLFNLEDIRIRIGDRINKEVASGTDMTAAINSLESADQVLAYAQQAVATATSTVDSTDPRPAYLESQAAYVALNQARDALDTVVNKISDATHRDVSTLSQSHAKQGK